MKVLLACLLIAGTPTLVLAQAAAQPQTVAQPPKAAVKLAVKAAAAAKPINKSAAGITRSARKAVEEVTPIDDDLSIKLSEADLTMAKQVFVGSIPCELGAAVSITPMKREGFFTVTTKGHRFRMHPVESRTGAIRLEDPKGGAMWLQLGNKSMLMSQKLGQRLADECQSPQQLTYADEIKKNPLPSILDAAPRPIPVMPAMAAPPEQAVAAPAAAASAPDSAK